MVVENFKQSKYSEYFYGEVLGTDSQKLTSVENINFQLYKPARAGVLVYQRIGQNLYFCLGKDRKHQELTDFAGGVKYISQKENALLGAWREFQEESLEVFTDITKEKILNSWAICNSKALIILCESEIPQTMVVDRFNNKIRKIKNPEIDRLIWIKSNKILTGFNIYNKIKIILKNIKVISQKLIKISRQKQKCKIKRFP